MSALDVNALGRRATRAGRAFAAAVVAAVVAAAVVPAAACGRAAPPPSAADRALAARVTGVWDVELLLDEAPPGGQVDAAPGVRPRVAGALTFLATARTGDDVDRWLRRPATHTGVYDLDVDRLGFALPASGPTRGLMAAATAPDSLVAVLPAGAADRVLVLRGTVAGDSARGTWAYAGRALPGWRGQFRLLRRPAGGA